MKTIYRAVDTNGTKIAPDMDNYFQMVCWIHGHPDRELIEVSIDWTTSLKRPADKLKLFKFTEVKK